jgi:hypothetical protein
MTGNRKEADTVIGVWQAYAEVYLLVAGLAILASFAVPLMVAPMAWARVFRWEIPQSGQLATFLGRSVGVLLAVVGAYAIRVAASPQAQPFFFELMIWLLAAMIALHGYGALRKAQPVTETAEIGLWVILLLVTLAFYPV